DRPAQPSDPTETPATAGAARSSERARLRRLDRADHFGGSAQTQHEQRCAVTQVRVSALQPAADARRRIVPLQLAHHREQVHQPVPRLLGRLLPLPPPRYLRRIHPQRPRQLAVAREHLPQPVEHHARAVRRVLLGGSHPDLPGSLATKNIARPTPSQPNTRKIRFSPHSHCPAFPPVSTASTALRSSPAPPPFSRVRMRAGTPARARCTRSV